MSSIYKLSILGAFALLLTSAVFASSTPSTYIDGALYATDGASLYIIDKATGEATLIGSHGLADDYYNGGLAFSPDGTLYALGIRFWPSIQTISTETGELIASERITTSYVLFGGGLVQHGARMLGASAANDVGLHVFDIDPVTGKDSNYLPADSTGVYITGMTSDGETIYAIERDNDQLGIVDAGTGVFTSIGILDIDITDAAGLALDHNGTLYLATESGALYTVDVESAEITLVGNNGIAWQGLVFAPADDPPPASFQLYLPTITR